jgi:hypothetical protein
MSLMKYVLGAALAAVLTACGGGGGSSGAVSGGGSVTTGGSGSTNTTVANVPTITLSIVDAADVVVSSNAIGSGSGTLFYVKAVVKDASATLVSNKLVRFSTDATVATLAQASALTDGSGVAKVQIQPVSLTAANAGSVVVSTTVNTIAVSANLDYQTSAANVTLANMTVSPSTIGALQSAAVTVEGRVNGSLAGSSVVTVNFSAQCGSFSPSSAPTNSLGVASTTYLSSAGVGCSGNQTLAAQAAGASTTTTVTVTQALPANVVFSSATEKLMVSSSATGGLKQSTLKFQVLDSSGVGMTTPQSLSISLSQSTISAGVTFSVSGVATITPQIVTTDSSGYASVTVSSGGLPTPVIVTAALVSAPAVQASSTGVAVTSGRATQNAASLSATKLSIDGFDYDGVQTTLTMRVADRQGNPVPTGSVVNFVAGYGLVDGTCTLSSTSQCNVTYTSQGIRPTNGLVAILAYMDGEESFVDQNGDNISQSTEPFYDVGTLYRDDNLSDTYDALSEQLYPGDPPGVSACSDAVHSYPSVANSCDGVWSSNIRVRQQIVIALATTNNDAIVTLVAPRTSAGFTVRVTDANGNAMPTGTTVAAAVMTSGATCKVTSLSPNVVRNWSSGGNHEIKLDGATDCLTVRVDVTVTSPAPTSRATVVGF